MPFFTRVFRSKDSNASKKPAKSPVIQDPAPPKPSWSDAWLRSDIAPHEVQALLHGCTHELKARALDTPFLLLPFRPSSDPSASRSFVRNYLNNSFKNGSPISGDALMQELRLTDPMVLCSVMKWCWSRLPGGVVTWEAYELFRVGEQDSGFARDAFSTFIPISSDSDARTTIIFDFFDLLAAIAAHGKTNGLGGRKLSRYAGWWAFEHADTGNGFDAAYKNWAAAADATSHLFFAYLRSISPDLPRGLSGISTLPIALQKLVQATEYPPEAPSLLQVSTTKVVMIVDTVSPTPSALLRRAKNFEYRDSDHHLQQFASFEDPIRALTDECLRVLRCISSTNQSAISSSKTSTSLRDASWSRFEDIGFGGAIESDNDDDADTVKPDTGGLRSTPQSSGGDLGHAVRQHRPVLAGDQFPRGPLHAVRVLLVGPAPAADQTAEVGVDGDPGHVERVAEDDVGRLAADAGQLHELLERAGQLPVVLLHQLGAQAHQRGGLVPVEAGGADVLLQLVAVGTGVVGRRGVALEQGGGDLVDPLVGALGREDRRHRQLQRIAEGQLAVRVRIGLHQGTVDPPGAPNQGQVRLGTLAGVPASGLAPRLVRHPTRLRIGHHDRMGHRPRRRPGYPPVTRSPKL